MLCESYKEALTDAAAAGEVPSHDLALHLSACPACRAAFAAEQQLFATIDSNLHDVANAQVPASLLPRMREGLDAQKIQLFSWTKVGFVFAAAVVMFAVTAVLFRGLHREGREPGSAVSTAAHHSPPKEVPAPLAPAAEPDSHAVRPLRTHLGSRTAARGTSASAEVSVLVPAGQREAVDMLLVGLQNGTIKPDALLVTKGEQAESGNELLPLGIPEIQIKPLAAVSEEPAPTR